MCCRGFDPVVEYIHRLDAREDLRTILDFLGEDYSDEKLRPLRIQLAPLVGQRLDEIAQAKNVSQTEAWKQLVEQDLKTMEKTDAKFKKLRERSKRKRQVKGSWCMCKPQQDTLKGAYAQGYDCY